MPRSPDFCEDLTKLLLTWNLIKFCINNNTFSAILRERLNGIDCGFLRNDSLDETQLLRPTAILSVQYLHNSTVGPPKLRFFTKVGQNTFSEITRKVLNENTRGFLRWIERVKTLLLIPRIVCVEAVLPKLVFRLKVMISPTLRP